MSTCQFGFTTHRIKSNKFQRNFRTRSEVVKRFYLTSTGIAISIAIEPRQQQPSTTIIEFITTKQNQPKVEQTTHTHSVVYKSMRTFLDILKAK